MSGKEIEANVSNHTAQETISTSNPAETVINPPSTGNSCSFASTAATFGESENLSIANNLTSPPTTNRNNQILFNQNDDGQIKNALLSQLLASLPVNNFEDDPNLLDFIKQHRELDYNVENNSSILNPIPGYNWEVLSNVFEYIYNLYTEEMKEIIEEFDKVDIQRGIWQESAYRMDGERASKRFKGIETWIYNSEDYLQTMRKELLSSVKVIKKTLNKFDQKELCHDSKKETPSK